jgi:Protein of unknown function (DUF2637)
MATMSDVSIMTMAGQTGQRVSPSGPVRTDDGREWTDRAITVMAVSGVTALIALGWALSYAALRQLALTGGMAPWAAILWPLCVDLFVFVATLAAISGGRRGRSTTYAWSLAVLYSAGTVAGNVVAAGPDHLAQVVHATPAVTMVLAWHLLSGFFSGGHDRTRRSAVRTEDRAHDDPANDDRTARRPVLDEVAAWVAEREAAGRRPTGDQLAVRFGVSDRTGRRMLSTLRSASTASASTG